MLVGVHRKAFVAVSPCFFSSRAPDYAFAYRGRYLIDAEIAKIDPDYAMWP